MKTLILAATFGGLFALASPAEAAFAIAFNPSSGASAANSSSFDLGDVTRRARSDCGSGCRVVVSGKGSCGAVVSAGRGQPWAAAKGTTRDGAARTAWFACRNKGGVNCETVASACD
jgi:hypothetical protein